MGKVARTKAFCSARVRGSVASFCRKASITSGYLARGSGLVGTLGSWNCLIKSSPVFGLFGIGARPFLIIWPASDRRHNAAEAGCNFPVQGSRMAASRSPASSEARSRSHASSNRLLALYSAWYSGSEGLPVAMRRGHNWRGSGPSSHRPAAGRNALLRLGGELFPSEWTREEHKAHRDIALRNKTIHRMALVGIRVTSSANCPIYGVGRESLILPDCPATGAGHESLI